MYGNVYERLLDDLSTVPQLSQCDVTLKYGAHARPWTTPLVWSQFIAEPWTFLEVY